MNVNLIAVLAATIVSMAIGFFWYSPMLFGDTWMKLMGITKSNLKDKQKEMGKMYVLSALATLVTAYVLAVFGGSLMTAFLVWLGFIMPVQFTDVIFGGKKWDLFGINTGYQLASLLSMAVVFGILG